MDEIKKLLHQLDVTLEDGMLIAERMNKIMREDLRCIEKRTEYFRKTILENSVLDTAGMMHNAARLINGR